MSDEETTRILKRKSYSGIEETAAVNTLNTVQKSSTYGFPKRGISIFIERRH